MSEAFICRRGGSGAGGMLTISAPSGVTVVATNTSTGKVYTKTADSSGLAVFKGLPEGTYSVYMTNGTSRTEAITVVVSYKSEGALEWFMSTISITYPATSTCVVTNSSGETVASDTNTDDSDKTWTATVNAVDTYTITATSTSDISQTKSKTVSITTNAQSESVTLTYELVLWDSNSSVDDWDLAVSSTGTAYYSKDKSGDYLHGYWKHNGNYPGVVVSGTLTYNGSVDLSTYKTVTVAAYIKNEWGTMTFYVGGSSVNISSTALTTYTLDISNVSSGSIYFAATGLQSQQYMNIYASSIVLT